MMTMNPFNTYAAEYDNWFDTTAGKKLFQLELECLKQAVRTENQRWLEVGVGSGRFAAALGIGTGADPAPAMMKLASEKGIDTILAPAEVLPFDDASFDGILMACTICFVRNPKQALAECHRTLRDGGSLVVGFIPAESRWGKYHAMRGREGHRFYSGARFYTSMELRHLGESSGLTWKNEYSCLLPPPAVGQPASEPAQQMECSDTGFIVLSFSKKASERSR